MRLATIIVDGALRSAEDLSHLLMILDPQSDPALWNFFYKKWKQLDKRSKKRRKGDRRGKSHRRK